MKKLHLFILKSFAGPLVMTFFITLFILVMITAFRFVDDIVGKGMEFSIMAEMLFYLSLQAIPMSLPLSMLLASLMTFGNLGEHYELTAIKASGVSLFRIMKPLIVVTVIICISAFWFANNVLPVANLKFYSIINGVAKSRPELDIREKVYYDGVDGFRIKVDHKDHKTGTMYDLIIHDHRDNLNRNVNVTMADSGKLVVHEETGSVILTLYSGVTYDEKVGFGNGRLSERARMMYRHDEFSEQTVMLHLEGFGIGNIDYSSYRSHDRMKNLNQLFVDADSLRCRRDSITSNVYREVTSYQMRKTRHRYNSDSIYNVSIDTARVVSVDSVMLTLSDDKIRMCFQQALRQAKSNKQFVDDHYRDYKEEQYKINRHEMEMHRKFTLPVACLLFFFVGAPLGAIIRKGGLGTPVVISVFFFIFYYVIDQFGAKCAREGVWYVPYGMWLSTVVLAFIGSFLTYKSATDSALFKSEAYLKVIEKIKKRFKKK